MGIDSNGLRLIAMLKRLGLIDLEHTAMLGRQQIFTTRQSVPPSAIPRGFQWENGDFAEPFFLALGAKSVVSYDNSDYEGATFVHDFNEPVPAIHRGRYSLLYDGGSIEHIFDVRQVIENYNALLGIRGSVVIHTQCNDAASHGFYQLSPEFFYNALAPQNGFGNTRVFLVEMRSGEWRLIMPPSLIGGRNVIPAGRFDILCVSSKVADCNRATAQQSDYEVAWGNRTKGKFRQVRDWRHLLLEKRRRHYLRQSIKIVPEVASADQLNAID